MAMAIHRVYKMGKDNSIVHRDEVEDMKRELLEKLGEARQTSESRCQEVAKIGQDNLQHVGELAAKNAADLVMLRDEAMNHTKECVELLRHQLSQLIDGMKGTLVQRLDEEVGAIRDQSSMTAAELDTVQMRIEDLDLRVRAQKSDLLDEFRSDMKSALTSQADEQERRMQHNLEGSLAAWKQSILEQHAADQEAHEEQVHDRLLDKMGETTANKIAQKAGQAMDGIQQQLARNERQLQDMEKRVQESTVDHAGLLRFNTDTELRLANTEQNTSELRQAVAANASVGTRSVEWCIPDLLRQLTGNSQSWFSPRFSAAGEVGLQLELQVTRKPPASESVTDVALTKTSGSEGEVVKAKKDRDFAADKQTIEAKVNLWAGSSPIAGDGTNIVFRLSVGGMPGPSQENRFGRWAPCPAGRMWKLDERLSKDDGRLRIVAEFLASTGSLELRHEPLVSVARAPVPAWSPAFAEKPGSPVGASTTLPELTVQRIGTLCVKRIVDNRMDERRKSCMVRRIDWRLERISSLKSCMPKGEGIYSTTFDAAGMEGLQLIFFPNGCDSAPSGYCSFFMHCPDGMPRCLLHIGKHRVEAQNDEYQPGWVGRVKLWHCEKYPDADTDSVSLSVELQEAPFEAVRVRAANDPRRFIRNTFVGGVEVRPPSSGRPKSSPKTKRRPAQPHSDSTLARGADTTKWMAQAYADSAQGYMKSASPRPCSSEGRSSYEKMPPIASPTSPGARAPSVDPLTPM